MKIFGEAWINSLKIIYRRFLEKRMLLLTITIYVDANHVKTVEINCGISNKARSSPYWIEKWVAVVKKWVWVGVCESIQSSNDHHEADDQSKHALVIRSTREAPCYWPPQKIRDDIRTTQINFLMKSTNRESDKVNWQDKLGFRWINHL